MYRKLLLFVVLALALPLAASAATLVGFPNPEAKTRRAEFLNYDRLRQAMLQQDLLGDLLAHPFDPAELKQFNVVLYQTVEEFSLRSLDDPHVRADLQAERSALEDYVRAGGGLVIIVQGVRYPGDITEQYYSELFKNFGLKLMHEGIWDPATKFTAPGTPCYGAQEFFKTTNIKAHPVTEGVARLCAPKYAHSKLTGCEAVAYGPDWTVVVSGEATAKSYIVDPLTNDMSDGQPATYQSAPPMAAVRDFGKGRVVAWSIPPIYATLNYDNPLWPQIAEKNGDAAHNEPSFGSKLLFNALRWAGEPSQKIAGFGGRDIPHAVGHVQFPATMEVGPTPYVPGVAQAGEAPSETLAWKPALPAPAAPRAPHRGIIGAHSAYSDGQGTVRQWADAALAAGLDFVVFSENLDALNADKLAALKKDCQAISAEGKIYLCPGYEYTDYDGCRWAAWGEKIVYPRPEQFGPDGKRVFRDGEVEVNNNFCARMLLTYDQLPGDAANLWWFYRVPLFVYDEDKLVADQTKWYLFGLDNEDLLPVACFTRIHSPASVAPAAARCSLNFYPADAPRDQLDTRCSTLVSRSYLTQGGAQGPQVEIFAAANQQTDQNLYLTAGTQRARLYFRVTSPVGLREINIYDGAKGIVRRFLPGGAKDYWREFEISHDRQHELVLQAIDTQGRQAWWSEVRLYSYKQGFYRCGDNLNMLGSTPTLAHPDRHDLPHWAVFEDWNLLTIQGFDTGAGVLTQPQGHLAHFGVSTDKGWEGIHYAPKAPFDSGGRMPQTPNRFALAGNEISIWDTNQTRNVKVQDNAIALGPFLPADEEFPYATIQHRIYLLRSRLNYYTTWDHRRPHEGAEDYEGDIFVHEGVVKFKQDVTLRGGIPISMEQINFKGASAAHLGDTFVVTDAEKGRVEIKFAGEKHSDYGAITKGGYVYGGPTDAGILALVPDMEGMRYQLYTSSADPQQLDWQVFLGLGKDGQQVKAGDELPFRYLCVTLPARVPDPEAALQRLPASFGLTAPGYPAQVEIGTLESQDFFFTGSAQDHEFQVTLGAWPLLLNRPFRIRGLEDNGTAALYVLRSGDAQINDRARRFRFVPVVAGEAWFQQNVDAGATLWVGNVFTADHPSLKLTLVMDGLTASEQPFLEVHNPTDAAITATIKSPAHTPHFGGFRRQLTIPAGDSLRVPLQP